MSVILAVLYYVLPALFIIWFMVNIVSAQRERNKILQEISAKLDQRKEQ